MSLSPDRIRALPCWNGSIEIAPLKGGLSNESFVVTDATAKHVVRFGSDFPFHHVFREREIMVAKAAHAKACKCSSARAQIPVMGGYLACDGDKPVERWRDMEVAVAKDVRDCGTCDAEAGPAACAREIGRLRASDAPLATYLETVHVPRCQKK